MLKLSTKLCRNIYETNIIHKAIAELDGQGDTEDAPIGFEVEVEADVDVVGVPLPYVVNLGASLFSLRSNSILTPSSPPCVSLGFTGPDGPSF